MKKYQHQQRKQRNYQLHNEGQKEKQRKKVYIELKSKQQRLMRATMGMMKY